MAGRHSAGRIQVPRFSLADYKPRHGSEPGRATEKYRRPRSAPAAPSWTPSQGDWAKLVRGETVHGFRLDVSAPMGQPAAAPRGARAQLAERKPSRSAIGRDTASHYFGHPSVGRVGGPGRPAYGR